MRSTLWMIHGMCAGPIDCRLTPLFLPFCICPPADQKLLFDKGVSESGKALREIGFWFLDRQMASRIPPESVSILYKKGWETVGEDIYKWIEPLG